MTAVVGKRDDCRFGSDSFKEVWDVSTLLNTIYTNLEK